MIIGQKEPQWLSRQHGLVHRRDLVRQRVHQRGVNGQDWVEEVRQSDAMCLRHQSKGAPVAVEAPGTPVFNHFEPWLIVPVDEFVAQSADGTLVGEFQRLGAKPLSADDRDQRIGKDAFDGRTNGEFFEFHHARAHG